MEGESAYSTAVSKKPVSLLAVWLESEDSLDTFLFIGQNCKTSRGNRPQFVRVGLRLNLTQCTVNTSAAFVGNGTGNREFCGFYYHWIIQIQYRLCSWNKEINFKAIWLTHTVERLWDANRFMDFILCLSAQAGYLIQEQTMVKSVQGKSLGNKIYVNNFRNKNLSD